MFYFSITSIRKTIEYLYLKDIHLKECYCDPGPYGRCSSVECFREIDEYWEYMGGVMNDLFFKIKQIKSFRISISNETYPDYDGFQGLFGKLKDNLRYSQPSNTLGNCIV